MIKNLLLQQQFIVVMFIVEQKKLNKLNNGVLKLTKNFYNKFKKKMNLNCL